MGAFVRVERSSICFPFSGRLCSCGAGACVRVCVRHSSRTFVQVVRGSGSGGGSRDYGELASITAPLAAEDCAQQGSKGVGFSLSSLRFLRHCCYSIGARGTLRYPLLRTITSTAIIMIIIRTITSTVIMSMIVII